MPLVYSEYNSGLYPFFVDNNDTPFAAAFVARTVALLDRFQVWLPPNSLLFCRGPDTMLACSLPCLLGAGWVCAALLFLHALPLMRCVSANGAVVLDVQ